MNLRIQSRVFCCWLAVLLASQAVAQIPQEPVEIGFEPQFVFDNWIIDNHWAIRYKRQAVRRVFHQAQKHPANPLMSEDQPSFLWVARDPDDGLFRMYYQANFPVTETAGEDQNKGRAFKTLIAYAESADGIKWNRPDLGLFAWHDRKPNNIVIARADQPTVETCGPCLLDVPQDDRQGFRWLMLYRAKGKGGSNVNGLRIVGSKDGIHWDADSDTRIAHLHSDHHNTISYDPRRNEYVLFCRAKQMYRAFGTEMIDTGASRRVARLSSPKLWSDWLAQPNRWPQTILIPDELDSEKHFNFFYGMPTVYRHGIYWGFLEPFRMNDLIQTELAVSRNGINFHRFAGRLPIIPYGEAGSWDDEMIFASPSWLEVGDQWWIYYTGWDGPHGTRDRNGAIGLAKIRKQGFVSLRGPAGGGVACTRAIKWPGGKLVVNAKAVGGELTVRVSDSHRKPLSGFDHSDCQPFTADSTAHEIRWNDSTMEQLKGQTIRLEFYLQDADLFTFQALP